MHPYQWIVEPLVDKPGYIQKSMFGSQGCYYEGRLVLVLAAKKEEPWNGILVPTEREHHESIVKEFPMLVPHSVLPKWLYLSEERDEFAKISVKIVENILNGDPRIGVLPAPKKKKKFKL